MNSTLLALCRAFTLSLLTTVENNLPKAVIRPALNSLLLGTLAIGLLSPNIVRAVPYDYAGTPADVVEGLPQYSISGPWGTGNYPGPTPENACQAAAAQYGPSSHYSYHSVTDLGGVDVFTPTTPYYHYYYCNMNYGTTQVHNFNMSRAYPKCPSNPFYHVVIQNYWQLIPPLSVNSCIRFLPPAITFDLTKLDSDFCQGNPIFPGTGNKSQVENDYIGKGAFPLVYARTYNSAASLGAGWRASYSRTMQVKKTGTLTTPTAVRPDGKAWTFQVIAGYWVSPGVSARLSSAYDYVRGGWGWTLITPDHDEIETYDPSGKLITIQNRSGLTQSLTYSDASTPVSIAPVAGLLIRVTDSFGRQLNFTYDSSSRVNTMTDPAGGFYQYTYDAGGNLTAVTYPDNRIRTYVYNESTFTANTSLPKALTGIIDENAQRFANFGYAASGLAIMSEHAGGAERVAVTYGTPPVLKTSVYFDPAKNLETTTIYYEPPTATSVTDALGTIRNYGFSSVQGIIKNTGVDQPCSSGCGSSAAALTYDANGNVASRMDFNGNKTTYGYDLTRNLETQRVEGLTSVGLTTPQTRTISTEWIANWRLPRRTAEPKRITSFVYQGESVYCAPSSALVNGIMLGVPCSKTMTETTDFNGSLGFGATAVTPANVRTWAYTYNNRGQVLTVNNPRVDVTDVISYTYYTSNDVSGNYRIGDLNTVTNALGHVTNISAYDAHGRPKTITDPNGLVTQLTYTPRGWLATRTIGALLTQFSYDSVGQLTQVTLPDNSFIGYAHDAAHRLYQITNAAGDKIVYTLDLMGNRTKEELFDVGNNVVQRKQRVFDSLSRLATELNAANTAIASYTYDNNGNVKTQTQKYDASASNDAVTGYDYDPLNRLTKITDALAGITQYGYNGVDHLVSVSDPRTLVTSYTVDGLDNQKQLISPDTGTTNSTYDAAGNLKTRSDARGIISTYSYDALNRVTGATFSDTTPAISYSYDDVASGNFGKGRLTKLTDATGNTEFKYDIQGRLLQKKQTTGSGVDLKVHTTSYTYNGSNGRLDSLTYPSGNVLAYTYDVQGRINSIAVNGFSLVGSISYQPFGPAKSWMWSGGPLQSRAFDLDGRQTIYPYTATGTVNLTYDLGDRVNSMSGAVTKAYGYDKLDRLTTDSNATYAYDANGNRTNITVDTTHYPYTYQANSNRLTGVAGPTVGTYTFDASGNVATGGGHNYSYDARGRLVNISGASSNSYGVNGLGQRLTKAGTGYTGTLRFVYGEDGKLMGEYDNVGALITEHVYLNDTPIAAIKTAGAYMVQADHLNTPRAILGAGNVADWTWDSEAFGATAANENASGLGTFNYNLRFPGQYYDTETALHYNYFRDYNPITGRYIESDPIGLAGGINTYAYVDGNPVSSIDPLGLDSYTFGAYLGPGFQITFGNDGGNGFVTGRVGFGLGAGISYNPNGGLPGQVPQDPTQGGVVASCSLKGNFNAGPLSAFLETGVSRNYNNGESVVDRGKGSNFRDKFTGINLSGSLGGQITIYTRKR